MFKSLYSFKVFTLFASIPQMRYRYSDETEITVTHWFCELSFLVYGIHDVQMYLKDNKIVLKMTTVI